MKELDAFSLGTLQDALNVMKVMERYGITREAVRKYVAENHEVASRKNPGFVTGMSKKPKVNYAVARFPKCPICGKTLHAYAIRGENPHGYKFRLVCTRNWNVDDPAMQCGYEELYKGRLEDYAKGLRDEGT